LPEYTRFNEHRRRFFTPIENKSSVEPDTQKSDIEISMEVQPDQTDIPSSYISFLVLSTETKETIQSGGIRSVSAEALNERLGTRESIQGGSVQSVQVVQEEGTCIAAPGSVTQSPEEAERVRIATHVQSILLATDGINQPHEALMNVVTWVQSIPWAPFPPLPPVVSVQSETSILAVTGMAPVNVVTPAAPENQGPCQEPPSETAEASEVSLPQPMAFEDISSDSDFDIVEDAELGASESRRTLTVIQIREFDSVPGD